MTVLLIYQQNTKVFPLVLPSNVINKTSSGSSVESSHVFKQNQKKGVCNMIRTHPAPHSHSLAHPTQGNSYVIHVESVATSKPDPSM